VSIPNFPIRGLVILNQKLLVGVVGNPNSGKSYTWNILFNREVRTGQNLRRLYLDENEYIEVFLVSGSPEERGMYVDELIRVKNPKIVLCSIQYDYYKNTIDYFISKQYFMFIQWLNPGYRDICNLDDTLGLIDYIIFKDSLMGVKDGKIDATKRVGEIRDFIYGWSKTRKLLKSD
jgi:hypothetical protein